MTGVSVDIGTSFVKPAGQVGDVLTAKAVVTGIGSSPAFPPPGAPLTAPAGPPFRQVPGVHTHRLLQRAGPASRVRAYVLPVHPPSIITAHALTSRSVAADHTKYIGKSAGHKHDVVFSEDGESVLEGEDIE